MSPTLNFNFCDSNLFFRYIALINDFNKAKNIKLQSYRLRFYMRMFLLNVAIIYALEAGTFRLPGPTNVLRFLVLLPCISSEFWWLVDDE